jgi:hypothetical protein
MSDDDESPYYRVYADNDTDEGPGSYTGLPIPGGAHRQGKKERLGYHSVVCWIRVIVICSFVNPSHPYPLYWIIIRYWVLSVF